LCLGTPPQPNDSGASLGRVDYGTPGVLSLGGADPRLTIGSPRHTEIAYDKGFFSVSMVGVGVGGARVPVDADKLQGTVVDTASPGLALPEEVLTGILAAGRGQNCSRDTDCALNLRLQGVCLNIVGLVHCHAHHQTCSELDEMVVPSQTPTLGHAALKDLYLELNLADRLVGFATRSQQACNAECSSFLKEATCRFAEGCSWAAGQCGGGMSTGGSTSRGSTVTEERRCFDVEAR